MQKPIFLLVIIMLFSMGFSGCVLQPLGDDASFSAIPAIKLDYNDVEYYIS